MSAITPIGFLDPWALSVSLDDRMPRFQPSGDAMILPIRGPRKGADPHDESGFAYASVFKEWPELQGILAQIERGGSLLTGGVIELGRVYFELLDVGANTAWRREKDGYFDRFNRLRLGIRTNPLAGVFCGINLWNVWPGQLVGVQAKLPCSVVNMGESPVVHLVADAKRRAA